jgi:hypothetical protein
LARWFIGIQSPNVGVVDISLSPPGLPNFFTYTQDLGSNPVLALSMFEYTHLFGENTLTIGIADPNNSACSFSAIATIDTPCDATIGTQVPDTQIRPSKIQPNPATETVQVVTEQPSALAIYDGLGRLLLSVPNSTEPIELQGLPRGILWVKVLGSGEVLRLLHY